MKTVKQTNIEGGVDEIEILDAQEIKGKKGAITTKTLTSWNQQCKRIIEDKLLEYDDAEKLTILQDIIKENWLKKIF